MLNRYSPYEKECNINLFHISNIWQPLSPAADTISTRNLQSKRRKAKRGHKESPEKKSYLQSHPHFFQPYSLAHWKISVRVHLSSNS
jgi:hypothetical protein